MMMYGDENREKLLKGVKTLTKYVKVTMGPRGRNVMIEQNGKPHVTKDGVTVATSVTLKDPIENMGISIVKEAANNAVKASGDGTTTTTVLTYALFKEAVPLIKTGVNPILIKRSVDYLSDLVINNLDKQSRSINDEKDLYNVALISTNGDVVLTKLITVAINAVGDGTITITDNKQTPSNRLEITNGYKIDRGFENQLFVNMKKKNRVELDNDVKVCVVNVSVKNRSELTPFLNMLDKYINQHHKLDLLMVFKDIDDESLALLGRINDQTDINICAVKTHSFGSGREEIIRELMLLTDATIVNPEGDDITLGNATSEVFGTVDKVIVTDKDTYLMGREFPKDEISALEVRIENAENDYDRNTLKKRKENLLGKSATIYIGGYSTTDINEQIDRVDDALGAVRAAVEEGILIGGGCALLKASIIDKEDLSDEHLIAHEMIVKALKYPMKQIIKNGGLQEPKTVMENVMANSNPDWGFDVGNNEYTDMFDSGITDPTKVTKSALRYAVAAFSTLITTEASITNSRHEFGV